MTHMHIYHVLLLFWGGKELLFLWITLSLQKIFHEYLLASVPKIGSVADSHKSFSANEDIQICQIAKL